MISGAEGGEVESGLATEGEISGEGAKTRVVSPLVAPMIVYLFVIPGFALCYTYKSNRFLPNYNITSKDRNILYVKSS